MQAFVMKISSHFNEQMSDQVVPVQTPYIAVSKQLHNYNNDTKIAAGNILNYKAVQRL